MDYKRREEIFSKEALTTPELAELFDCSRSKASSILMEIKRVAGDRLHTEGRIHIQDYLNWLCLDKDVCKDRYIRPEDIEMARKLDREALARSKQSVFTMSSAELKKKYGGEQV